MRGGVGSLEKSMEESGPESSDNNVMAQRELNLWIRSSQIFLHGDLKEEKGF